MSISQDDILNWMNLLLLDGQGITLDGQAQISNLQDLRRAVLLSDGFMQNNPEFAARNAVWELRQAVLSDGPVKLSIGSAAIRKPGWIATDIDSLDITSERHWAYYFAMKPVQNILAEHVLEHLTWDDNVTAMKLVADHLAPGGRIRIAVPDGNHPDPDYINRVKPGGYGDGSDDHKLLFTIDMALELVRSAGLEANGLEYYDSDGQFHCHDWSDAQGHVMRSARHDPRNQDGVINYTSIIVDGIKG